MIANHPVFKDNIEISILKTCNISGILKQWKYLPFKHDALAWRTVPFVVIFKWAVTSHFADKSTNS